MKPRVQYIKKQKGDMLHTRASIKKAKKAFGYNPQTKLIKGVGKFISWYKSYYQIK